MADLPDNNVLTVVCYGPVDDAAQLYDLKTKQWLSAGVAPGIINTYSAEVGPEVLLPDGNVLALGASPNNALYTSTTGVGLHWRPGQTSMRLRMHPRT